MSSPVIHMMIKVPYNRANSNLILYDLVLIKATLEQIFAYPDSNKQPMVFAMVTCILLNRARGLLDLQLAAGIGQVSSGKFQVPWLSSRER